MINTVATWRCKCGVRIKVMGETELETPQASCLAECPNCGDRQTVLSCRIISTTVEPEQATNQSVQKPVS
jgi:hypothetical protein